MRRLADDMDVRELARARRMAASGLGRTIREASGTSRQELAEASRVHRNTIFRWETGRRRPRGEGAIRWLHMLEELSDGV